MVSLLIEIFHEKFQNTYEYVYKIKEEDCKKLQEFNRVLKILENIVNNSSIQNMDVTITFGLNLAHYNGNMSEYFGLYQDDLDEISNLDYKNWEVENSKYLTFKKPRY